MKIVNYHQEYATEWNSFNRTAKNGLFLFDRNFMEYHSNRFTDHSLIVFDDEGDTLALFPANLVDGRLCSHQGLTFGGFVTDVDMHAPLMLEIFVHLIEHMCENNISSLLYKPIPHIYHRYPAQEDLYALFRNNAVQTRVDVSVCIPYRHPMPFSRGKVSRIKKARRLGLTVRESSDYEAYMDLVTQTLEKRYQTLPTHTAAEIALLASRFPSNIRLFVAERNGELMAGTLIFLYDTVVHTQYLANSEEGRDIGALDLVIDHTVSLFANEGKEYFDFGISNEQGGMYLNEGLITQKERFGARAITHHFYKLTVN